MPLAGQIYQSGRLIRDVDTMMPRKVVLLLLLACLFVMPVCLFGVAPLPPGSADNATAGLAPQKKHVAVSREILKQLDKTHCRELDIDDRLASRLLDRYLEELDAERVFFLAPDVRAFEPYRTTLDDALKRGDLQPAFTVFKCYRHRFIDRLASVLARLEAGVEDMDFSRSETLDTDREDDPWATTQAQLDEVWRKRLKANVLSLELTGKSRQEIATLLHKRYASQLAHFRQINSDDVFALYINALAQLYDPHTRYFSPRATENFNIHMSLSLEGIGAVLQAEDEYTKIVRLIPAGPADKSKKLHPSDRIVGVGQGDAEIVDVIGWRLDEVVELIRGPKGTGVRLEIIPADAVDEHSTRIVEIVRDTVRLEEQAAKQKIVDTTRNGREYRIGVIDIPTFYLDFKALHDGRPDFRSTTRDVHRLLEELQQRKIDGLIVDLRNNGGGALQEVSALTGLFIDEGPVVQVRDADGEVEVLHDPHPGVQYRGPLVVLVNRLSASASEIFAGAIQDYHRGLIVGEQTFGKGTVQSLIPLSRGQLKSTVAKFYRVSGESTQHRGIIPDIDFPGVYAHGEIGESELPGALPWDRIEPARFAPLPDLSALVRQLQGRHEGRTSDNPDFAYLKALTTHLEELRSRTELSLNQEARARQRSQADTRRLAIENARRVARGQAPLETIKELEREIEAVDEQQQDDDPLLQETAEIVVDCIEML